MRRKYPRRGGAWWMVVDQLRPGEAVDDGYKIKRGTMVMPSIFPRITSNILVFSHMCSTLLILFWLDGCATEKWDLILTHNIFTGTYYGRLGINCTKNRLNLNELTGRDRRKRRRRRRLVGGWNGWVIADWGSVWQSTQYADGTLTHL